MRLPKIPNTWLEKISRYLLHNIWVNTMLLPLNENAHFYVFKAYHNRRCGLLHCMSFHGSHSWHLSNRLQTHHIIYRRQKPALKNHLRITVIKRHLVNKAIYSQYGFLVSLYIIKSKGTPDRNTVFHELHVEHERNSHSKQTMVSKHCAKYFFERPNRVLAFM